MNASSDYLSWTWDDIEPYYRDLQTRTLDADTLDGFLREWSSVTDRVQDLGARLSVATTQNTADEAASRRYQQYVTETAPRVQAAEQSLKDKLLASGLEPKGFDPVLRGMRADAEIFREENLPLLSEEELLGEKYYQIVGARTAEWNGEVLPLQRIRPALAEQDRDVRERAWRTMWTRQLADRAALNELWSRMLELRGRIGANAGLDYRAYRWLQLHRFDYTPSDAKRFADAVESEVVPLVARRQEERRRQLGVETLRPWDLEVDPFGRPPLRPFSGGDQLMERTAEVFRRVDGELASYFDTMRAEGLLDLESRPDKAPGGYCTTFSVERRPFIFANAAGTRLDVETLLHEGGHAFHTFETAALPYHQQRSLGEIPMEFVEVGSMAMEFLGAPFLADAGFYTPEEAVRARTEHLEQRVLTLWTGLAAIETLQHWVYENPDAAADGAEVEAMYASIARRFSPVVDWTGLDDELRTGWHNILHIFVVPFYNIEYALALLGAVAVWSNAQRDREAAVTAYKRALALGNTASLPDLFAAAGAKFAFDAGSLRMATGVVEDTLAELRTTS